MKINGDEGISDLPDLDAESVVRDMGNDTESYRAVADMFLEDLNVMRNALAGSSCESAAGLLPAVAWPQATVASYAERYAAQCAACHGKTGKGRGMFPMLVGQYTNYLKRQVDLYLKGDRPHDETGTVGVLNGLKEQDIQDVLAYLTSIQEPTE